MDPNTMVQRLEVREYWRAVTERFRYPGVVRDRHRTATPADLEADPSEGGKHVRALAFTVWKPRFGHPSLI